MRTHRILSEKEKREICKKWLKRIKDNERSL